MGIAIRQKSMFTPMLLMLMLGYLPNIRLRVRTHSRYMTVAARAMADRKTFGQRS
jgi:hypothetical protein